MRRWRTCAIIVAAVLLGGCCSHRDPTTGLVVREDCGAAHAVGDLVGGLLRVTLEIAVGLCGG